MESYMRPGCTHLTLNALMTEERLAQLKVGRNTPVNIATPCSMPTLPIQSAPAVPVAPIPGVI